MYNKKSAYKSKIRCKINISIWNMQISHVRMHAIIKERYIFPKKRNVLVSGIGSQVSGIGKRESGIGNRESKVIAYRTVRRQPET